MNMLWIVAGASLVLGLLSWNRSRRLGRRLEQLTQMYWELKYQHGELRVQVQRLSGEGPAVSTPPPQPADSFIPLASLKK